MSETNKTYRNAGFYKFGDGFTIQNNAPIDCRTYVNNITDIYDDANWTGANVKPYPGMIVSAPSGDVKIYVGEVITDIAAVTSSSQQIAWRNKANWLDVNIPKIEPTDAGRLLTVVETTNDDQTKSYSAQWVNAPSGLPEMGQDEAGKLLTVVETSTGSGVYVAQWVDAPSGLPTINGMSDANKILQVNSNGTGVAWVDETKELPTITESENSKVLRVVKTSEPDGTTTYSPQWTDLPKQIPPYTIGDRGKVLTVSSDETDTEILEWNTIDTSFVENVTTSQLASNASMGLLKPGMRYRITDYSPSVNPEYRINIDGVLHNIGTETDIRFDIIATASSINTLFDDVELVFKDVPNLLIDYSKYEVKYDLFGNTGGHKYAYLGPGALGVIYYMKDQFGNEASYDFENIFYLSENVHGMPIHTFAGLKHGDLRFIDTPGIIQNVRIKHSVDTLPGVIFELGDYNTNKLGTAIHDVEIDNCDSIYISYTSLHHAKFSNSRNVSIKMSTGEQIIAYPMFENLNIYNNDRLSIISKVDFLLNFNDIGGFYINNFNVLPTALERTINIDNILVQTIDIFKQGLIDANVINALGITPQNGGWLLAILEDSTSAQAILCGRRANNLINTSNDRLLYDAILNASKNIKPFDIFNMFDARGFLTIWNLEIPQFQSTATSVVELGI